MDPTRVMTLSEIRRCVLYLQARSPKSRYALRNLCIFRLSSGCGLRCKEISELNIRDVKWESSTPVLIVRKDVAKNHKARKVPLDLDSGTRIDISTWIRYRTEKMDAGPDDPVICVLKAGQMGERLSRRRIFNAWKTAVRALGKARVEQLSTHSGRHSFGTHTLRAGYSLPEVRDWLGHSSIAITDKYTHAMRTEGIADLYGV